MPFFLKKGKDTRGSRRPNNNGLKRKREDLSKENAQGIRRKKFEQDEDILSDDVYSEDELDKAAPSDSEAEYEDNKDNQYRQAKALLDQLIKEGDLEGDETDEEEDRREVDVADKLRDIAAIKAGTFHRKIAASLEIDESGEISHGKHRFPPLDVALSPCLGYVISSGKDSQIIKYDLKEKRTVGMIRRRKGDPTQNAHSGHILAVAISSDGKYLATGGTDCIVKIWDAKTLAFLRDLKGHLQPITSLCFRLKSIQLFSASRDRQVKLWDMEQMGLIDTMYGQQDAVLQIDCLNKERVLTCGGQDRTIRLWKVDTESQLVLNGPQDCISIDCVAMLNEDHFVSGSADGSLCVWSIFKKKPTCIRKLAHGEKTTKEPYWVVTVAAVQFTDLVASGSNDGNIRFWRVTEDYKSIHLIYTYEMQGFVNRLKFSNDGTLLACAVGREHKFGRWWVEEEARNKVCIIPLTFSQEDQPKNEERSPRK